ncbi:esterase-like activity of phytase family protein [uncultured Tessaracoccus sp.]|uniref:esterase-like activity of phytase family protein n=1 Tax=uncultured Tessaracoccus sp. TaxID=905023 RepID=UPI0025EC009C|nr:esterase-like activity of phytase family protein [uncultured Tessaracoccus sp.]
MHRSTLRALATGALCAALALPTAVPAANADAQVSFKRVSTTPAYLNATKDVRAVAEISAVTPDGKTLFHTDAGGKAIGKLDIADPANPTPLGRLDVGGEPTSVYVVGNHVLVVVDSSDGNFTHPSGHVSVLDAQTFEEVRKIDLGGQPDSIDVHGTTAAIAIENQRDEEAKNDLGQGKKGDLPQSPAGELAVLSLDGDVADWTVEKVELAGLPGLTVAEDPEPEYVKFSPDGTKIALTLQENNAVAIIDAKTRTVLSSWSAGEATVTGVDTEKDGQITLDGTVTAAREPDSIGWIDDTHVATANEGDWRGGTRGWTIFDAASGEVVWDAGNTFEYEGIRAGHWNEGRAAKKGSEPEGLAVATFRGVRYAFVGSERANYVAVYDVTDPAKPRFTQLLPTTNGPEGILPIPGRDLLAVSSEEDEPGTPMRATVSLYEFSAGAPTYPQIQSEDVDGKPIGWLALGALAASSEPGKLYTIADNALAPNRILTVDATGTPARITSALPVTKDGEPTKYDVEGLHALADGGFWLGVEGDGKEQPNQLVRVDAEGRVTETVQLPDEIAQHLGKWGIEGVTANPEGSTLYVALQRDKDATKPTRIVEYDVASGAFRSFGYELTPTDVEGDWMGLSEITFVAADEHGVRLALIERDKQAGPDARVKDITEVTIPADAKDGDMLTKRVVTNVLDRLRATHGWTQEKLEGMTIDAAGNVFVVTDNDGLDDINGETVFLNLGRLFADDDPATPPVDEPTPGPSEPTVPAPGSPEPSAPGSAAPTAPSTPGAPAPTTPGADPTEPGTAPTPAPGLPRTGA